MSASFFRAAVLLLALFVAGASVVKLSVGAFTVAAVGAVSVRIVAGPTSAAREVALPFFVAVGGLVVRRLAGASAVGSVAGVEAGVGSFNFRFGRPRTGFCFRGPSGTGVARGVACLPVAGVSVRPLFALRPRSFAGVSFTLILPIVLPGAMTGFASLGSDEYPESIVSR